MLEPIWFSPRGAAITRGGIDYTRAIRKIWLWKNFIKDKANVSSLNSLVKIVGLPKNYVSDLPEALSLPKGDKHIIFKSDTCHNFLDLHNKQNYILNRLRAITLESELKFVSNFTQQPFIGINVRTGKDFVSKTSTKTGFQQTDVEWFVSALKHVRRLYGSLPAIVVSDGGKKQLSQLLNDNNVFLLNSKSAIADLLILTHAKVLLASGNSTFCAWASFLGRMDTFTSPNTPFVHHISSTNNDQLVATLDV
ncbi:MAG: alpha-1,2-fucosyltransferase [Flavisolibacter sp.]